MAQIPKIKECKYVFQVFLKKELVHPVFQCYNLTQFDGENFNIFVGYTKRDWERGGFCGPVQFEDR